MCPFITKFHLPNATPLLPNNVTPQTWRSDDASYLSGFVELLLQPRYRHGCYTVVLAGNMNWMLQMRKRRKSRSYLYLVMILQPWLTPVYAVLQQRDLL
ncbi:hypothetical protein PBY51_019876 [Eleginops maclovinus]|uniref:Uncharacterized protein n=1 Tax=Eleginops maclovinus TaxID=56733 RepID=A0AAN7XKK8_ELEMC|nr:hypothetical protein PBY51_019876 [Eleginops maclovinus]